MAGDGHGGERHETDVLVVGGGPVGLTLAVDLAWRGVRHLVLEQSDGTIGHPKVGTVGPRSMELFRRWGLADRIRAAGWPGDHPLDIAWATALGGYEIHRLRLGTTDTRPPLSYTPEPEHPCPQHWLSPLLAQAVGVRPGGPLFLGCRLDGFTQHDDRVTASATDLADGRRLEFTARYLVACDGASSPVRKAAGVAAPHRHRTRSFRNILFRAPELRARLGSHNALVHFLTQPPDLRYPLRAMDGRDLYRLTVLEPSPVESRAVLRSAVLFDTPMEVLSEHVWHLTHRVTDRYRHGRVLFAGDAAHTLAPAGGFGMNTGLADAADLGWKIAGTLAGWAGPGLLDSYDTERRPIAERSLAEAHLHVRRTTDRVLPQEVLADSPEGARAREELARVLKGSGVEREFSSPEMHFGYRYVSPLVLQDGHDGAPDVNGPASPGTSPADWRTAALPGGRAPHAWLAPGLSTLDLFGPAFHLLCLADAERLPAVEEAFRRRRVPFRVTRRHDPALAALYGMPHVLVRPDGHVAWRGVRLPDDPGLLVDTVRGAGPAADAGVGTAPR
ncbi:FAD-binding monooxygenase [Streptomyces griseocarneus]|nr:FAD-binding monooxygenase [Streptomyces griseocarneus]